MTPRNSGDIPSAESTAKPERLAFRLRDIVTATGLSRRTLERERSAGRFPPPDRLVGRAPLWRRETLEAWLRG
jgi:predicted DNA-binding transcriptional regulator AlpA